MNELIHFEPPILPRYVTNGSDHACMRFIEFFTANIRNSNTRRAYAFAVAEFMA